MTQPGTAGNSNRVVRIVITVGIAAIVWILARIALLSEPPSLVNLTPIPTILLVLGLVDRRRPDPRGRSVGRALLVLAGLGYAALVGLYVIGRSGYAVA